MKPSPQINDFLPTIVDIINDKFVSDEIEQKDWYVDYRKRTGKESVLEKHHQENNYIESVHFKAIDLAKALKISTAQLKQLIKQHHKEIIELCHLSSSGMFHAIEHKKASSRMGGGPAEYWFRRK